MWYLLDKPGVTNYINNCVVSLWYVHSSFAGSAIAVLKVSLAQLSCLDAKRSGGSNPKLRTRRGFLGLAFFIPGFSSLFCSISRYTFTGTWRRC